MLPNATLIVECLCAICEGTITLDDFRELAGIKSMTVTKEILKFLLEKGIGMRHSERLVSFSPNDRLKTSILAVSLGADILKISEYLSWRDFERFASEILLNSGFQTMNNVRFIHPRAEIDIVATRSQLCLSIDCKHWANKGRSGLVAHTRKQLLRTERLLKSPIGFRKVVPVLLTIYPKFQTYHPNFVTVVDIRKFQDFVNEIDTNLDIVLWLSRE